MVKFNRVKTVNFLFIHVNEFSNKEFSDAIPISQAYLLSQQVEVLDKTA